MSNCFVQISDKNTFRRLGADKVNETNINKDTRIPGGTTGTILYSYYDIIYGYVILHTYFMCLFHVCESLFFL